MTSLIQPGEAEALLQAAINGELPDERGRFGPFGGRYVPETLVPAFERLEAGVREHLHDPQFQAEYQRELAHFARTALDLDGPPGAGLAGDLARLVTRCAASETALCHRDYHARNLLLQAGRVRVIDHQDALPGPAVYDRVSLAYDPYVALDDATRDALAGEHPDVA